MQWWWGWATIPGCIARSSQRCGEELRNRSNCSRHVPCRQFLGKGKERKRRRVYKRDRGATRPLNRCKIFDSELATVQRGEERCSLLERGGRGCGGQWMEFSTMLGPLFPHILCFSPTSAWNGRCGDSATEPSGKTSGRHFLRTFPHLGDNKPPTTVRGGDRKGETLWCGRSYVFADR